jgi:transcriptional regulator with XRE-family HTH domain
VEISRRLGVALREARLASGRLQREVAADAGISQTRCSDLERGRGAGATIATWALAAEAVGEQLVVFLERVPGAERPRDYEHLRRQQLVIRTARDGGWKALPEMPIDTGTFRSRSVDVLLARETRREAVVVEVWDWFADLGAAIRDVNAKQAAAARLFDGAMRIQGLWIVRGTHRNRILVREFRDLLEASFPGSPSAWLRALADPGAPMPPGRALLWTDAEASRLIAPHRGRP